MSKLRMHSVILLAVLLTIVFLPVTILSCLYYLAKIMWDWGLDWTEALKDIFEDAFYQWEQSKEDKE